MVTEAIFTVPVCCLARLLPAALYTLLAWYLDKVVPDANGTPLPLHFPFLPAYWLGKAIHHTEDAPPHRRWHWGGRLCGVLPLPPALSASGHHRHAPAGGEDGHGAHGAAAGGGWDTQEADPGAKAAVEIRALRKAFRGGLVAVKGLDLTIYTDQITALLGHNGAGKACVAAQCGLREFRFP